MCQMSVVEVCFSCVRMRLNFCLVTWSSDAGGSRPPSLLASFEEADACDQLKLAYLNELAALKLYFKVCTLEFAWSNGHPLEWVRLSPNLKALLNYNSLDYVSTPSLIARKQSYFQKQRTTIAKRNSARRVTRGRENVGAPTFQEPYRYFVCMPRANRLKGSDIYKSAK